MFLCILYPVLGYIIMIKFDTGIYGYSIIKLIKEVLIFVTLELYLRYCCKKEEIPIYNYSFTEIKSHLKQYFIQFFKFWLQPYIAYLGWELSTIILAQ